MIIETKQGAFNTEAEIGVQLPQMKEHLSGHAKTMLNKQLHILDGLEHLSEGKPSKVKDYMEEADGDKKLHCSLLAVFNAQVNYSTYWK